MTDYLGPLTLGTSGTYQLITWQPSSDGGSVDLEVVVKVASADALAAAVEALVAQLSVGNTYVHYQPGVTNPVAYRIVGVSGFKQVDVDGWLAFWQRVSFTLSLAAMPAGALQTLYSAQHVDTPASVSLAALLGTQPTPLDVTIDDDSGNDMHSVWAALAPTALSDAKWLVKWTALSWTTLASTGSANCWSTSYGYTTSASYQTANLDTSQYPAGKYKLLARVSQAAGIGYVMDSQNGVAVPITHSYLDLIEVGDLDLPVADTAPGVAANLTLSLKSYGVNQCAIDAFVLLPLDYGFFRWKHDTPASEIDQLDVGPSGVFMDGVNDATYFRGSPLVPRTLAAHVGTLVATPQPVGSSWPSDWYRSDAGTVTADTNRFKIALAGGSSSFQPTTAASPLVIPGAWYEVTFTRQVTAFVSGLATFEVFWNDVDGNLVYEQGLDWVAVVDGSPVGKTYYVKAPVHAARAILWFGSYTANLTVYYSNVVMRRCPLRLILVAQEASGTLVGGFHPVHLTVKSTARYAVAR